MTGIFTALVESTGIHTHQQVSPLVDTWLLVTSVEGNGERNRVMYVLKLSSLLRRP